MKKFILPILILTISTSAFSMQEKASKMKPYQNEEAAIPYSDSDIVNILMTINTEEMNLSKLGKSQAQNQEIKDFAEKMLTAHSKNNDQAASLRREQKIKLTETKRSNKLITNVEKTIEDLKMKEGKNFDKAYMDAQVIVHQKALESLEMNLVPNAKNTELKIMLEETMKHVEGHLREAKALQSTTL